MPYKYSLFVYTVELQIVHIVIYKVMSITLFRKISSIKRYQNNCNYNKKRIKLAGN